MNISSTEYLIKKKCITLVLFTLSKILLNEKQKDYRGLVLKQ